LEEAAGWTTMCDFMLCMGTLLLVIAVGSVREVNGLATEQNSGDL